MTKTVTRCPQCGTAFRITAAQLQSAKGAVRCGACLHIFRARDHLIDPAKGDANTAKPERQAPSGRSPKPETKTPSPKKPEKTEAGGKLAGKTVDQGQDTEKTDEDDFLISDDMDSRREPDEMLDMQSAHATSSLFERKQKEPEDEPEDTTDESWAMSLLESEEEEADGRADETNGTRPKQTPKQTTKQNRPAPITASRDEPEDEALFPDMQMADTSPADEAPIAPEKPDDLILGIDPEPVEMAWRPTGNRRRKLLWALLSFIGLMLLAGQFAWLQFDRLSRLEPYRSAYAFACPLIGCELPALKDTSQIRASNLVVRDHPDTDNALMVDAILLNHAPFEQPFPSLGLEFSNLAGEVVANREFDPSEYLSGELAGRTVMPQNQPVHLTLELVDPGPEAVNYRVYIPD